MPGISRGLLSLLLAALAAALFVIFAATASADIKIRQIHPSNNSPFGGEWVELQMPANGQNQIGGDLIRTFFPDGSLDSTYTIPGPAPNGQSQRTVLISSLFTPDGVSADFVAQPSELEMTGNDGAVCLTKNDPPSFTPIDCVSYGAFTGTLPAGTPAVATPFESTLERKISSNCRTALDEADDTNNSAADFALSTNSPRNNSTAPTEKVCQDGNGGGKAGDPNTKIKKRPKNKSADDSPTFKFKSTETGSTFKCKLDQKKFHKCKSPKTYHGLDSGKHKFKVEAIDSGGNIDNSPAKDKFKVL